MMCTKGIFRSMAERDPFLRSSIDSQQHRADLHKAYLQLSQSITDMLRPPTPESDEAPKTKRPKPKSNYRKNTQRSYSRRSNRSTVSNYTAIMDKYRLQTTQRDFTKSRQSNRPGTKKDKRKTSKPDAPIKERTATSLLFEDQRQKYSIRYSKVLDIFKRKLYRDIIEKLGIHINNLDDPDLVEIDLAWCKVGTFILESRENTGISFAQFVEDTASIFDDFDDRMSMYSSFSSFLPPLGKSSRSVRAVSPKGRGGSTPSKSPVPDIFDSSTRKSRSHPKVEEAQTRQSRVPKLPAICEDI